MVDRNPNSAYGIQSQVVVRATDPFCRARVAGTADEENSDTVSLMDITVTNVNEASGGESGIGGCRC